MLRFILLLVALTLFLAAGIAAAGWWLQEANPVALIAFGLASWLAAALTAEPRPIPTS